jgi:hypothetical protein
MEFDDRRATGIALAHVFVLGVNVVTLRNAQRDGS